MVVDLTDVTFVDEGGEKLLWEMRVAGAKFVAVGVETKYMLENLNAEGERPLRRYMGARAKPCDKTDAIQNGRNK
jgi:hypothetical protein